MNLLSRIKNFFTFNNGHIGSETLKKSGYKPFVDRLLDDHKHEASAVSDTLMIDLLYWLKLFQGIRIELLHFKAKDITSSFENTEFNEENISIFFEKYMRFDSSYVNYTLAAMQSILIERDSNKRLFNERNFLNTVPLSELEMLDKVVVMLHICLNRIEKKNYSIRYLVDSSPRYYRSNDDLPPIGSPFNISLIIGEQMNSYGFFLDNYYCNAIDSYQQKLDNASINLAAA